MNLCEYQKRARSTAIYLNMKNSKMIYPALGLIGECGEVAEKVKKLIRDDDGNMSPDRIASITKELGDCCWYLANICCDTGLDLSMMYEMRGAAITHEIRGLMFPQLVLHMNRHAASADKTLEEWYYVYGCRLNESGRFTNLPQHLSYMIACIEEIARRCGFALEDICVGYIVNLEGRKQCGNLSGDGDIR